MYSLCRETSVSRTANVSTVGMNGLNRTRKVGMNFPIACVVNSCLIDLFYKLIISKNLSPTLMK